MRHIDYSDPVALNQWERDVEDGDGLPLVIPKRYEVDIQFPELEKDYDWQITYKFSASRRKNFFGRRNNNGDKIKYGSDNLTFRRLYLILCKLNGGISFIDDYLENVLPYNELGKEIKQYLAKIKEDAENSWETFKANVPRRKSDNKIYKRWVPKFALLKSATKSHIKAEGEFLAHRIKEDLEMALADGRVPLSVNVVSSNTQEKRLRAGLNPTPRFYASGQFIQSITLYFRLEKKGKWKTDISV